MFRRFFFISAVTLVAAGCSGGSSSSGSSSTDAGKDGATQDANGNDANGQDAGDDASDAAATGALDITINVPAGVTASVDVTGPQGFSQTLSSSQTLSNIAAGDYTITANAARKTGDIVDEVYTGNGGSVTVVASQTAQFTVDYTQRPGTGKLWVPVWGASKLNGYSTAQLATGGATVTPNVAIGLGTGNDPYSGAFDAKGNYFVGTQAGALFGFTPDQLAASGTPTPAVTLDSGDTDINGLAFDAQGNLWVTTSADIREFSAASLTSSGSPTPAVVIGGNANTPLSYPAQLAFDKGGALWVAAIDQNAVYKYSPSQLAASGSPEAAVVISSTAQSSLDSPRGLAFDADGALWVANFNASSVVKFTESQLVSSGAIVPAITLTGVSIYPVRIAFDNSGNLWFTATFDSGFSKNGRLAKVAAANLVSSGTATVEVDFTDIGSFDSGGALAFNPPPSGLPLAH
jgi:sugar lactone lactonase YvrE